MRCRRGEFPEHQWYWGRRRESQSINGKLWCRNFITTTSLPCEETRQTWWDIPGWTNLQRWPRLSWETDFPPLPRCQCLPDQNMSIIYKSVGGCKLYPKHVSGCILKTRNSGQNQHEDWGQEEQRAETHQHLKYFGFHKNIVQNFHQGRFRWVGIFK